MRKIMAAFWAILALAIPFVLLELAHAPSWIFFPAGCVAGCCALLTYFVMEG